MIFLLSQSRDQKFSTKCSPQWGIFADTGDGEL